MPLPSRTLDAVPAFGAILTVLLTALATGFAFRSIELEAENRLARLGSVRVAGFRERLNAARRALESVRHFDAASELVQRSELETFTAGVLHEFPEIVGLAWVAGPSPAWGTPGTLHLLHGADRAGLEGEVEAASLPGWKKAMDAARNAGAPVLVEPDARSGDDGSGRWLIVPVGTADQGGFLAGRLDLDAAARNSVRPSGTGGVDLYLLDGTITGGTPVLVSPCTGRTSQDRGPEPLEIVLADAHHTEAFRFAGHLWTTVCSPSPSLPDQAGGWVAWAVLSGGVLSTIVLLWLHALGTRHSRSLRTANHQLCREVERRRESEEAQRVATLEAQAANLAKGRFLAIMSHELRTPLNGVIGMAHLLRETSLDDEQRAALSSLRSSAEVLLGLVGDVIDFARMEAGTLRIQTRELDLRDLVQRAVDLHADEVASKGLSLTCEVDPQVPRVVRGDALRLTQVLLNLVGNAVKFTDEGAVEVGVHLDSRVENDVDLRVVIADSGPGIEADLRQRLFEPFTQADDSMSRRHGGLGLGLSICKEIVERMGGTIQVESARPRGCVAWFSVRLEVGDAVAPDSAVPVEPALPAIPVAPTADPREDPEPRASSLCGVHALLVEDNTVNQMVARGVLERAGCVVHVAGNGQEAVDAVGAATFDIILMDCQMPVMDGYEATAEIRRLEANDRRVPIIAVTAHALPEERARCLDVGMDDFVSKPFRPSELIATIERALGDSAVAA